MTALAMQASIVAIAAAVRRDGSRGRCSARCSPMPVEIPALIAYPALLIIALVVGLLASAAGLRRAVRVDPASGVRRLNLPSARSYCWTTGQSSRGSSWFERQVWTRPRMRPTKRLQASNGRVWGTDHPALQAANLRAISHGQPCPVSRRATA